MKIRALGTGGLACRHPLVTESFLIQSEDTRIVVGFGPNIPAKLESINIDPKTITMWVPLSAHFDQIGALDEINSYDIKPYLVAPHALLEAIKERGFDNLAGVELRKVLRINIKEPHFEETITFQPNYGSYQPSFGLSFETSELFITGVTPHNDTWLHRHGAGAKTILHSMAGTTIEDLQTMPVYLQKKTWLYGYPGNYQSLEDPIPMIYLPQGTWIYDSSRKDKHLEKERFLRENAKRVIGNANT